jgi:hypothetical protein
LRAALSDKTDRLMLIEAHAPHRRAPCIAASRIAYRGVREAANSLVAADVIGTRNFRLCGLGNPFVYADVIPD